MSSPDPRPLRHRMRAPRAPVVHRTVLAVLLAAAAALGTSLSPPLLGRARADESPATCAPTDSPDVHRYLRTLTLDLLGRIPTMEEHSRVERDGAVTDANLDEMLSSDGFYANLRRYHRELLLTTLDDLPQIVVGQRILTERTVIPGNERVWVTVNTRHRGGANVWCVGEPQRGYGANGRPLPHLMDTSLSQCPATGCNREGYVEVEPYWAPGTTIKVCAYDAQAFATGTGITGNGTVGRPADCTLAEGITDPGCGCGPNLASCVATGPTHPNGMIREAMVEEPLRIFEHIVRARRPYFEALTTRETMINGPLAYYYAHFVDVGAYKAPAFTGMASIPFDDPTWRAVERPEGHAGVLTTFAHLIRFASHRGRANHFFTRLLCQPFDPGEAELPPSTEPCSTDPNLMTRCGCASCHTTLEPAAAHFSRFRGAGQFGRLTEEALPDFDATCAECEPSRCSAACNSRYVTKKNHPDAASEPFLGLRLELAFLDEDERRAASRGPTGLVDDQGPALARCATRRLGEHLFGRSLDADELVEWLPRETASFQSSGYDFVAMIRRIVTSDEYRRVR